MHGEGVRWTHEWASVGMLKALWARNAAVRAEAARWGIGEAEEHFIAELVLGGPGKDLPDGFV